MQKIMYLIILLLMLTSTVIGLYSNQPRFRSDNGHLYIESATSHNISLNTKGQGYINVNNENLLQVIGLAKEAWEVVDSFRTNEFSSFTETLRSFGPLLEGPRSLSNRLTVLETQLLNSTTVTNVKIKGGTFPNANKLGSRLTSLEKKVANLVSLLTVSECLSNPCQNGGTCMDLYNGFQCYCPQNWQGKLCEVDVDECVRFMHTDLGCQNGAECKNTPGTYECLCAPNWYGLHCTRKKNDCNLSPASELCGNGICVNQVSTTGYTCICNQGWTTDGNGPACTKDVDECKDNSHTCSANPPVECRNTKGSFTCANCPIGFEGDGFVCTDVNECLTNNGGCSINPRVQCINSRGSFRCESCPPGYSGDGFNCIYQTEGACAINNGGCHPKAVCSVYAETSIQCTCRPGYTGYGYGAKGCDLLQASGSPCTNDPCGPYGRCIEKANNTFSCQCSIGYTGNTCNIRLEDPCFINPCHNDGICENGSEPNGFSCNCRPGYFGPLCESVREACGGYFDTNNGTIRYPESNNTLTYHENMNCNWIIDVDINKVVNISFSWIDIEKSDRTNSCRFDWVEILNDNDEENGKSLGKFCGKTLPQKNSIISDSSYVTVRFHSDASKNFGGFQLQYTTIQPDCGGVINIDSSTSHGTLSSPGSPGKYPPNRDCFWTLNATPGKRIQINFFSLQIEIHQNCSYDYLVIRDGFTQDGPILSKLCNTTVPPPILTSSPHAHIHFHSDSFRQDYGFQIAYSVQSGIPGCGDVYTSPFGTISSPRDVSSDSNNYLDNLDCEWHIKMPLHQKLKLTFVKKFRIESSKNCSSDFLEIHDGPNIRSPLIGRYCGSAGFDRPIITNSNEVTLFFKSDFSNTAEGFTIKYETLCGGTFTDSKGIIESPFYPNPYPQNKICTYIIKQPVGKAIQLSFLDMEIEDLSYPNCFYDSLEIRDGDNENSTKIALLCGKIEKLPKLPYISTHNFMWLKFTTDHSNNNKGFRANYSTVDIACGGILNDPAGIIQSSKNSEEYLHNQLCEWIISVNESSQIQITWLSFSLENHAACKNDYVEVYDNSIPVNASKIGRYCGTKIPPILTSVGNRLTIVFKTDHSVSMDGFMLSYISLSKSQACGGNFFSSEGVIRSPNYPNDYPKLKDCTWIITVPVTNQIELLISQFRLEEGSHCYFDYLEIRNGGYRTSPLIGKYCGTKINENFSSMGNSLFIRFVSDGSRQQKGFVIQWYTTAKGCGGVLNSGIGHIISPNYPLPVQETLECFYKIAVVQGSRIKLIILDLELATESYTGVDCKEDFLEIFDGGNTASKSLGLFCSDTHPTSVLYSTSNQMYIKFRSSGFSKGRGFSISYATDCNVILKGHQGAIEIAKHENTWVEKCRWTIVAPKGSKINMTFTSFKMVKSRFRLFGGLNRFRMAIPSAVATQENECNNTHLSITEGADINEINTILWRKCESEPPSVISSTKNIVSVNYNFPSKMYMTNTYENFRLEWLVDGCGGVLDRLNGEFTSPGYPGYYPLNTTCEWKIVADHGFVIQITIEEFWFEVAKSCSYDFLAVYSGEDDSGPELLKICHRQTNPVIVTSGGNVAFVKFESDALVKRKGFKASYETIPSKCGGKFTAPKGIIHTSNYPQNYDSNSSCMWYIEVAETHLVNLTFTDFSTRKYPTNSDRVLVYDGDIHGQLLLNHSGNTIPSTLISSSNKLLVSFEVGKHELRAKGFSAIYSMACGAKLVTNDSGIITRDESQFNNCTWSIISGIPQSKVTLTFTHLEIAHLFNERLLMNQTISCSDPQKTHIRILDGRDSDAPEITKLCNSDINPPPIVSNGPAMYIEFVHGSKGIGSFTASYTVRSNACGGTYDLAKGTISSPNYPNNYLRDLECVWILKSSVGNRISLNFINFELEEEEFCNEDYVEVREQDSVGPILGIFCGSNLPKNVTTGSSLWIKFRSNSIGSAKGFTADFEYVSNIYLTQKSGEITSPMYPKIFRGVSSVNAYSWTINVDQEKRIQIVLKEFICSTGYQNLKIYDGSNNEALILLDGNYNNEESKPDETVVSSSNIIFVQLKSYQSSGGSSFLLSWTQIDKPYAHLLYPEFIPHINESMFDHYLSASTNSSVIITSPGYPNGYAPNLNVTWTIHTDSHSHIEINFLDVDLYPLQTNSESCYKDFVKVETVDLDTAKTKLLKTVCKNTNFGADSKLVGKSKVILTFFTNNALNGTGFKAEAKLKCGGQFRGSSGVIDTTNITSDMIGIDDVCVWNITARPGKTISVKFITLQLESRDSLSCSQSYVLLKNGFYDDSPVLGQGKYCVKTNVTTLSTTENKLQVIIHLIYPEIIKISYEEKSINCGGQIYLTDSNNVTQITSPSYPNIPPAHIECIWIIAAPIGERISASIEDLDLYDGDSICEKEYLEFRDGAARFSSLINRVCNLHEDLDIETKDNFLYIKYFTDINIPSNGFKLNVTIAKCGGTRHSLQGQITSPNYPGSYESGMNCEYRIVVSSDRRIVLEFHNVNLKRFIPGVSENTPGNDTRDDSLTIYDVDPFNSTRIMLTKIYGSNLPSQSIESSGRELIINFKSQSKSGPFYVKNSQTKFLMEYWTVYNECGKSYNVESGEITSPQYNNFHVARMSCGYTITVPQGRRITAELVVGKSIVMKCDDLQNLRNLLKEKLLFFHGYETYNFKLCIDREIKGLSQNYIYESNANKMTIWYMFENVSPIGFRIKFSSDKPALCGGTIDASTRGKLELPIYNVTKYICEWEFGNGNGTFVMIANFIVAESNISCRNDYLLKSNDVDNDILYKSYCPGSNQNDKFIIQSPLPTTKVSVIGKLKTINYTATIDYFVNPCGGIIEGQTVTITSPNYPKNYEQNTNCVWLVKLPEGGNVNIRFNDIDLDSTCDSNYVMFHDGPSPESPVLGKYCGNVLPDNLVTISNNIWVVFSSESGNNKKGFNVTLESTQVTCGQVHVSKTGEIKTKNFPNLYPNNDECEWILSAFTGNRVSLQFVEQFNLEQSVNCTKDYVQIFDNVDGNWLPLGSRLCGRQLPPTFNSSETKLKVRIRTDSSTQGYGFKAKWTSICGGVFTESTGKIVSPNYPRQYSSNLNCNYTISAPGKSIQLVFKSFAMEDGGICHYDNLTIYEQPGVFTGKPSHIVNTFCGQKIPRTMMFMGNVMMIFKTDSSVFDTGFEIDYEIQECGGEITAPGIIKSPTGFDETFDTIGYGNNINCEWTIRAPPGQVVQLVFTKFRLERDIEMEDEPHECEFDAVFVYDGPNNNSTNSTRLGVFCGVLDSKLPEIKSNKNVMYVQFKTDTSRNDEGFVAEVSFTYGEAHGCGGTIKLLSSYTLKSPSLPTKTAINCGWLILAEPSHVVQVEVIKYTETPKCPLNSTDCRCSSIEFLDGPGYASTKIRQYCSKNIDNPTVSSSTNQAFIQYKLLESDIDIHFELKLTPAISICGPKTLVVTNQTQVLTSPNYPLSYPNNLVCSWSLQLDPNSRILVLRFTDLDLEATKDCSSDYLELRYMPWSELSYSTLRLCHDSHEFDFMSRVSALNTLKLRTNDKVTSKGFRLEYKSTNCQTLYEKRYGRIYLDHAPESSESESCTFTINVGQPNLTISVYFSIVGIVSSTSNTHLKIYDGPTTSSSLLTTLNELFEIIPSPVFSSGPILTMVYTTSSRFSSIDFSYTSTDQGKGCGGRLFSTAGSVTSPMYPMTYRKSSVCGWSIAVPPPNPISIAFRVFNLGSKATCETDYVELFDVDQISEQKTFIAKYCGDDSPAYHINPMGAVFIKYTSSIHNTGSGWVLNFRSKKDY